MDAKIYTVKRLQIMLPYLNTIFEVGQEAVEISQISKRNEYEGYGRVTEIKDCSVEYEDSTVLSYVIRFESGKRVNLDNVPAQLDMEAD